MNNKTEAIPMPDGELVVAHQQHQPSAILRSCWNTAP
jgi:hypothetical protein